ncbi:hypothetical protein CRP143_gp2 [Roseobacter phage CRP-143]|nr:hypothetical protein CRP143_gp2 [Roseobacter phage CRP-143]
MTKLLTKQTAKLEKTQTDDVQSVIMYLDPLFNKDVCKGASAGCRKACLINSGRMRMDNAVQARRKRTELYYNNREVFDMQLRGELMQALADATRQGKKLAVRLNGTSDLDWGYIYAEFPMIQFYEYTKRIDLTERMKKYSNVMFTFSKHEGHSVDDVKKVVDNGINVAVVFAKDVPTEWQGLSVLDGDKHDRRYEDSKGQVVGLKLKGTNKVKEFAINRGFAV